jgi:chromodomain-helicase-DNA-binding protein 1
LIVVPLSTISGWTKEIKKWTPNLYVVPYIGDSKSRNIIREYEMYTKEKNFKFNILLTTYELILKDCSFLSQIKYSYLLVDEAHRLKNDQSKLYEILKQFPTAGKLLITGTPLQNSIKELWNLLHFLMPQKYANFTDFETKYASLSEENQISKLHENLAPHILRRLKSDVEKSLPKKVERILRIERTPLQKKYYRWILEKNFSELNKGGHQSSLLNIVIELKKVCNHPFLFDGARNEMKKLSTLQGLVKASGKMELLDKLLTKLKDTGHRYSFISSHPQSVNLFTNGQIVGYFSRIPSIERLFFPKIR